ncbi:MAG: hypothetical protein E7355_00290 [Clostridiales bacterium]|nr:hypothetical protein [Clostridiales bacterium]
MIAKFFLGIAIVAFTTFCGYLLGNKYRKRKLFFTQWTLFNERFLNEISYYRNPLQDFFVKYSYKGEFEYLLQRFLECVKDRQSLKNNLIYETDFNFIKADEKVFIEDYFAMLGKGDSSSQKNHFSTYKNSLFELEKQATETCKKYVDLYIKLGFLFGLFILILIL